MRRNLFLAIATGVVLGLFSIAFWQDLINELILLPISYLTWFGNLVYRSFDQQAVWTALIILVIILAWVSLRLRAEISRERRDTEETYLPRIKNWHKRLEDAEKGTYMKWRLAQHISELVLDTLAYRAGIPREQIEQDIDLINGDLPEALIAYLQAAQGFESGTSISKRLFNSSTPQPLDLSPETMLTFLEKYLGLSE